MAWKNWYVALVGPTDAFDPTKHNRADLPVTAVRIKETEDSGQALVSLTCATPQSQLLAAGKSQWVFLSRELQSGQIVLVASGYVAAVPVRGSTEDSQCIVEIHCGPIDWDPQLAYALATSATDAQGNPIAQSGPSPQQVDYCDPLFMGGKPGDAREILDGWFAAIHCDRRTHSFSFPNKWGLDENFNVVLAHYNCPNPWGQPTDRPPSTKLIGKPVSQVQVKVECEFVQAADGALDVSQQVMDAFQYGLIDTLAPEQLERSWFRQGAAVNGASGWTCVKSQLVRVGNYDSSSVASLPTGYDFIQSVDYNTWIDSVQAAQLPASYGPFGAAPSKARYVSYYSLIANGTVTTGGSSPAPTEVYFQTAYYSCTLVFAWRLRQKIRETAKFTVMNGCQPVNADFGPIRKLNLKTGDVTDPAANAQWSVTTFDPSLAGNNLQADGQTPIPAPLLSEKLPVWVANNDGPALANANTTTYFATPRGGATLRAAANKARRILSESTRCVEIQFRHEWTDDLVNLDTNSVVTLSAPGDLLDGGAVTAKVYAIEIYSAQDDEYADVTLRAGAGSASDATYDSIIVPAYTTQLAAATVSAQVVSATNSAAAQASYLSANDYDGSGRVDENANDPTKLLKNVPTTVSILFSKLSTIQVAWNITDLGRSVWLGPKQIQLGD